MLYLRYLLDIQVEILCSTLVPCLTVLHFIMLHRCCIFNIVKARLSTGKKITTQFNVVVALLQWFRAELAISLRYACL